MISKGVKIRMQVLFRNTGGCATVHKVRKRYHCEDKVSEGMEEMRDSVLNYFSNRNLDRRCARS